MKALGRISPPGGPIFSRPVREVGDLISTCTPAKNSLRRSLTHEKTNRSTTPRPPPPNAAPPRNSKPPPASAPSPNSCRLCGEPAHRPSAVKLSHVLAPSSGLPASTQLFLKRPQTRRTFSSQCRHHATSPPIPPPRRNYSDLGFTPRLPPSERLRQAKPFKGSAQRENLGPLA